MSPRDLIARIAGCKAKAERLLSEIEALSAELPQECETGDELHDALAAVRAELDIAVEQIEQAIDYLTPRSDEDDPGCCAHRRLQAVLDAEILQS